MVTGVLMPRLNTGSRLMRFYARRRKTVFAGVAAAIFLFGMLLESVRLVAPVDYGYWLQQLFVARGVVRDDPGVEIVAFDKTFDPGAYAPEALAKEPLLGLLANGAGTRYDRAIHAAILDRLAAAGARQVMFDFVFEGAGPGAAGDRLFAEALKRHRDKVVIGFSYSLGESPVDGGMAERFVSVHDPDEAFLADENPGASLGFVNFWPEANNSIARTVGREDKVTLARPSMTAHLKTFEDMSLAARAASRCGATIPDDNRARLIGFAGPAGTIVATSVHRLLDADGAKLAARYRGKVVVVGPYSEIHYKGDRHPTPVGFMAGAEIQANCVRNWIGSSWIREPFAGRSAAIPSAIVCLLTLLAACTLHGVRGISRLFVFAAVPVAYVIAACAAFGWADTFLPFAPAAAGMLAGLSFAALDFIHAQYERRRIRGIFGTYLSPVVVNRIVDSGEEPELGGEQVNLTAFFADVRHFSTFAENLAPAELVTLMNAYLGEMTRILESCDGALDKYVGDGIVAMFGAPVARADHAASACVCALRMQRRLAELRAEWLSAGGFFATAGRDMRMRIGLNTGLAVVGNMGSARRFNYTMMGDAVNLAARCESQAREWGVETLAAEDTVAAVVGAEHGMLFRKLGHDRVKGRAEVVALYEVVCFQDGASGDRRECIRLYEAGLATYEAGDRVGAAALFAGSEALERAMPAYLGPEAPNPSKRMLRRCADTSS